MSRNHGAFAVNLFDPLQSRLAPANLLPIAHSTAFDASGPGVPRVLREVWPWIATFLLLVLCVEWWFFSRSYTLRTSPSSRKNAPSFRVIRSSPFRGAGLPSFRRGGGGVDVGRGPSWPPARWAGLSGIRFMAQTRYKATMKRIARARKRLGGGRTTNVGTPLVGVRRSKGKRNADV